jgi:hypothetical protein
MKRGRGRPIVLNAALTRRVCGLLRTGSTIKSAMILCGVAERSFHSWMKRGQRNEQPYKSFFDAASRARETHKANLIQQVVTAAKLDWRAASFLLERQFPHEYAAYDRRAIPTEPEPEKKINVAFIVDTGGKTLQEVGAFPVITEQAEPKPGRRTDLEPPPTLTEVDEPEPEREWNGDVASLGRVVRDANSDSLIDLPLGNGE